MSTSALSLAAIDAYYGDSHVLHGVAFELGEGRLLGLLGRNGAGKTTSMSVAIGLVPPRKGSVKVFGKEVAGFSPERISAEGVALVPQGRRIFKSLSVRENLIVAYRKPRGIKSPAWTLERVFETFPRLKERHSQFAGSLSGGEQQMLAIGRALMSRPRLLLLDEPSLGLAPLIVRQIFDSIGRIAREEGVTIFLVEQNAFHALRLADRGYVLANGRVRLSGSGKELLANQEVRAAYLEGGHG